MSRTLLPLVLLFTACSSSTDTADTAGACDVTITTYPASDAASAYYRTNIEVTLDNADPTVVIETDIPGTQSFSEDGLTVYYTPTSALTPNTDYSYTVHYCGGDPEIKFHTSDLGTAVTDPQASIKGSSYLLNLKDATITEPASVGALLGDQLGEVDIYVNATEVTETQITMVGAIGNPDATSPTQDWCSRTIDFPVADFSQSPHFIIGGTGTTTITVAGVSVDIQNLEIAGDFAADGSYFGGGTLSGTIDTRPLDVAFFDGEEGALCKTAGSLGAECQPCGDGQNFCLSLKARDITATKADIQITPIFGDDCLGCAAAVPADNSETCAQEPQ